MQVQDLCPGRQVSVVLQEKQHTDNSGATTYFYTVLYLVNALSVTTCGDQQSGFRIGNLVDERSAAMLISRYRVIVTQ